ncbi:putative protein PHLOEM PROTEIN 2-LIKE A3, partial [Sinocyclocheilus rhinocerous]|uniref:putative protein PHLOEM PROTEIN 2-LIKE A3 n=1 Tax=Sinocyclocheilus rhinocerous TaxID=307959 RepID=UPI0007BAD6DF
LLFPGTNAFLLVHRDVKNSGSEFYLLKALSGVFGKEVLDYCVVLFIDEARHDDPRKNTCLKMCGGRYHILQNTDESLNLLFKKTEAMTQWKSSNFFTNNWEFFRNAENYFEAEYKKKENTLRIELAENKESVENLKKEIKDMKELDAKKDTEFNERIKDELNKLAESKDRETKLRSELAALKSSENQKEENFQKLKEELTIYKKRENELS